MSLMMFCRACGIKHGTVKRPAIAIGEYVVCNCLGCGEDKPCAPAHKFKITLAAARSVVSSFIHSENAGERSWP
jgi:hypothetical protein